MAALSGARTLLVTGGAGYIGSHVCKAAAAAGFLPVAFDDLSGGHRQAVRWGPLERGDLRDGERVSAVLAKWRPHSVIHLAGVIDTSASVGDPAAYYSCNVTATLSLLDAMRKAGIGNLIFSSTAAVYGEPQYTPIDEGHGLSPLSPYGASKRMVEQILHDYGRAYGVRAVALRYFNAAGADLDGEIGEAHRVETHLIPLVLETVAGLRPHIAIHGDDYETRDGTCVRDFVHVADLARAHLLAVDFLKRREGVRSFNLGSGEGATVREIVEAVESIVNRNVPVRIGPRRVGDPAVLLANPSRANIELGWRPALSDIETIVASAWNWHKKTWQITAA